MQSEARKQFIFEKKNQKTFVGAARLFVPTFRRRRWLLVALGTGAVGDAE
jgi:hypothetical protein